MSIERPKNRANPPTAIGPNADLNGFIHARISAALETMQTDVIGLVWLQLAAAQRRLSIAGWYGGHHPAGMMWRGMNKRLGNLTEYAIQFAVSLIDSALAMYPDHDRVQLATTATEKSTQTALNS